MPVYRSRTTTHACSCPASGRTARSTRPRRSATTCSATRSASGASAAHTALVGGYAVEGHVPSSDIRRLLKERPNAIGIAVPGMPIGSPGMDGPEHGPRRDPYDVLLVRKDGSATPFQTYR